MTLTLRHYGILIDPQTPITGVVHNCTPEFLIEETINGIDLAWEEHLTECQNEDYDDCYFPDLCGTVLIGSWKQDENGLYGVDKSGDYAAIVGEIYTQVIWSHDIKKCALCSPCYPGQGDLDTPGQYLTYDLPKEFYGE